MSTKSFIAICCTIVSLVHGTEFLANSLDQETLRKKVNGFINTQTSQPFGFTSLMMSSENSITLGMRIFGTHLEQDPDQATLRPFNVLVKLITCSSTGPQIKQVFVDLNWMIRVDAFSGSYRENRKHRMLCCREQIHTVFTFMHCFASIYVNATCTAVSLRCIASLLTSYTRHIDAASSNLVLTSSYK